MESYIKAGWHNNMSAHATYNQIYHLRRLLSKASRDGDRRAMRVYARMIYVYSVNQPDITFAALKSHTLRGL